MPSRDQLQLILGRLRNGSTRVTPQQAAWARVRFVPQLRTYWAPVLCLSRTPGAHTSSTHRPRLHFGRRGNSTPRFSWTIQHLMIWSYYEIDKPIYSGTDLTFRMRVASVSGRPGVDIVTSHRGWDIRSERLFPAEPLFFETPP